MKASPTSRAKIEMGGGGGRAGTTPEGERAPSDGFSPTIPLSAAGTRPDPAVSVPSENGTRPAPTAVGEPGLDPPGMRSARKALPGAPGARPDPSVSVPSENGTRPAPTAVAEPELDPPGMRSARNALRGIP